MARTPPGPPAIPAVQKIRLQYAKRGRLKFSSHRDFQRMLERALRRCEIPMAYSAGFTPHPKISFAGAAPTGMASEAEFVELGLVERVDPDELAAALSDALPEGMDIVRAVESTGGSLADRLTGSVWEIALPGVSSDDAESAAAELLTRDTHIVTKVTKKGHRDVDVRAAIVRLTASAQSAESATGASCPPQTDRRCAILHVVVRHTTPVVRPDDVLAALRDVADLAPDAPAQVTRRAQGLLDAETATVADPLAAD